MRELGRADRGRVHTQAGEELRTGHPIELEMALRAAASVEGYLGLLAHFARRQPESELVLRSLLAPSLEATAFATIWSRGEEAWTACRARARHPVGRRPERPGS